MSIRGWGGGGVASTSGDGRAQKGGQKGAGAGHNLSEHPVDFLSKQEFWVCFHVSDNISILLINNEPLTSKKQSHNAIISTRSNLMRDSFSLCPISSSNFSTSPRSLQPFFIQILFECWWDVASWTCSTSWTFPCWKFCLFARWRWVGRKDLVYLLISLPFS